MACGLPVIATHWSSQTDFMNSENSLPIEVEQLIPAIAKCPYYDGFQWAQASYEHLRAQMRWVYENQEKGRAIGMRASEEARQKWTWEEAAKKIAERIKALS